MFPEEKHQLPMQNQGVTSLVVIQPTPFCNINCSYCYLPQRSDRTTLTIEQIQRIFEKLFTFPTISGQVTVVWHAGEPLVLGPQYYEDAFRRISEHCPPGLTIEHAVQTNGILINDEWCDFFRRWKVGVGISIDGPRAINDAFRKTRSGKGTFDKAVAGIGKLQQHQIPFYVISVLTRDSLANPDAMFSFYRELDIHDVGFNIEEQEGVHDATTLGTGLPPGSVQSFLRRFNELMRSHDFHIVVREIEETLVSIRHFDKNGPINNLVIPFGIITVDVKGGIYTFSPEIAGYGSRDFDTFSIGNVFTDSFEDMRNSSVLTAMSSQIAAGVELCRTSCRYFSVCGGGAPSNKVFENGTFASTSTTYCELTKKRVTDFLLEKIEAMA
jgi:uncharacterized protein